MPTDRFHAGIREARRGGTHQTMTRYCLLLASLLAGCSSANTPATPMGHFDDDQTSLIAVNEAWKSQVFFPTREMVKEKMEFPKTAAFEQMPDYNAFYDGRANLSYLQLSAKVRYTTPYGRLVWQTYIVTWEKPGKVDPTDAKVQWQPDGATLYDIQ